MYCAYTILVGVYEPKKDFRTVDVAAGIIKYKM
jgi:hypothetical protein